MPFFILDFDVPEAELKRRIERRSARNDDPSDAGLEVLAAQIRNQEPLTPAERGCCLKRDSLEEVAIRIGRMK